MAMTTIIAATNTLTTDPPLSRASALVGLVGRPGSSGLRFDFLEP